MDVACTQHVENSSRERPIICPWARYYLKVGWAWHAGTPVDHLLGVRDHKRRHATQEIVAMFKLKMLQLTGNRKRLALLTVLTFITLC